MSSFGRVTGELMTHWVRFEHRERAGFGQLADGEVEVFSGDMFDAPTPTGETLALDTLKILTPTVPSKMIALANNFHALLEKLGMPTPVEPLYFLKPNSSFHPHGQDIRRPASYTGKVIFEGELGLVVAKHCKNVTVEQAHEYLFGCTCINDVTAIELLNKDPAFAQWTRAKAPDTFGVFGPSIATDVDPSSLEVRSVLNGQQRQHYPVSDMVFTAAELISHISKDMSLMPGDVIACGTSVGVGSMKPGSTIQISIDGIGTLENTFH